MAIRPSRVADPFRTLIHGGAIAGLTDAQLLERFTTCRGELAELAFAGVVARHGPMVLAACRGLLRNTHDAEDAFQATFLILARKAGSLRRPDLIGPWLYGVAQRCARQVRMNDARRRWREAEAAMSRAGADADGREFQPADSELAEALHEEIGRLPERYRVAVVLCDLQGLTHEEAGRLLGRPAGTVSSRLSRARERLRGRLSRRGMAAPATVAASAANHASAVPVGLKFVPARVTAGVVPASISTLSLKILRSMMFIKSMIPAVVLLGAAAAGTVAVVSQQDESAPRNASRGGDQARKPAGESPSRGDDAEAEKVLPSEAELIYRSEENLRRIGEAIQARMADGPGEVTDASRYPASAIFDADGTPLLSWRVAILPYLGEGDLYDQFKLDEPWDGPHNKELLRKMPKVYAPVADAGYDHLRAVVQLKKTVKAAAPVADAKQPHTTFYRGFTGKGAFFEGIRGLQIREITDGTTATLMVAEAETAVPWTKPEELTYEQGKPLPKLGGQFKNGITAVTADGYSRFLPRSIRLKDLEAMITRSGGEVFPHEAMGQKVRP